MPSAPLGRARDAVGAVLEAWAKEPQPPDSDSDTSLSSSDSESD